MKYISVFIPTFNGEKYLEESLNSIYSQKLPTGYGLEVLLTDSGSFDNTLRIVDKYRNKLVFNQIPNSEFSHSQTRMKAAKRAKGEFMVFVTQDATPIDNNWLRNLIEPFFLSDKVGIVFGRQVPRPNAAGTIKREVTGAFMALSGSAESILVHRHLSLVDNQPTAPVNTFFSDVNSAVKRKLLVDTVPFRNISYAEDQALAKDMLSRGYLKAYAPLAAVWHSNEYSSKEYMKRKFDEYIGLRESTDFNLKIGIRSVILGWIKPTLKDWQFILKDRDYSLKSKIVWSVRSPLYNYYSKLGFYLAFKHFNDRNKRAELSLDANNRR